MVYPDTNGCVVFLADIQERHQLRLNLLKFLGILLVRIFQMFESASRIDIVAWIDTYFLTILRCHICNVSREMYVGYQRLVVAVSLQAFRDIPHVLSLTSTLCGKAHQFTACINDALGLCHRSFRVVGVSRRHRLDADGVVTADGYIANSCNSSFSANVTHILLSI